MPVFIATMIVLAVVVMVQPRAICHTPRMLHQIVGHLLKFRHGRSSLVEDDDLQRRCRVLASGASQRQGVNSRAQRKRTCPLKQLLSLPRMRPPKENDASRSATACPCTLTSRGRARKLGMSRRAAGAVPAARPIICRPAASRKPLGFSTTTSPEDFSTGRRQGTPHLVAGVVAVAFTSLAIAFTSLAMLVTSSHCRSAQRKHERCCPQGMGAPHVHRVANEVLSFF